jgi:DNA-directed RNA polymerase specialized sigma24 family protein
LRRLWVRKTDVQARREFRWIGVTVHPHLAEDAVQQAMLDIWCDIGDLRDPAKFRGWSYRLLVRICYAESKHKRTRNADNQAEMPAEPVEADAHGAVIRRDQLKRAFDHLSMEQGSRHSTDGVAPGGAYVQQRSN